MQRFGLWLLRTLAVVGGAMILWQSVVPGYLLHEWLTVWSSGFIDWDAIWRNVGSLIAMVILAVVFMIFMFGPKEAGKKGGGILSRTIGATTSALGTLIARIWCWWWGIAFPGAANN